MNRRSRRTFFADFIQSLLGGGLALLGIAAVRASESPGHTHPIVPLDLEPLESTIGVSVYDPVLEAAMADDRANPVGSIRLFKADVETPPGWEEMPCVPMIAFGSNRESMPVKYMVKVASEVDLLELARQK